MEFREFGLILFVERYEECISFYRDILQLEIRNVKDTLVSFELPNGYLMVEQGGVSVKQEKSRGQNPTVLRFDVESLIPHVNKLEERGVRRSEEHTSELQSRGHLVCRLLLEKKKTAIH